MATPTKPPPEAPKEGDGAPAPPRPGRRAFGVLLVVLFGALILAQVFSRSEPRDEIRYDELKRWVREGRVSWVHIAGSEITGEYVKARKPPPRPVARPAGAAAAAKAPAARPNAFVTPRVDDDTLVPLLESRRVPFRGASDDGLSSQWLWIVYLVVSLGLMALFWGGLFRRMGAQAGGVLSFGKSRGKVFQENDVHVTFEDVAGVDEAKEELQEIIDFLKSPERYKKLGARIPKGVMLVGPPGTGKTLLARAVAGEAKVPFISISGSEFVEMFVGVGAARVRDLFEQAERAAPCIVFIDELDALGRARGGINIGGSNDEREQTLNQLLVEMDGFEPRNAVIIMAATNRAEILDAALLRPGRFDRQILVDRPDRNGRDHILRVHARNVKVAKSVDLGEIAARTPGFAGADLANLVNEAALLAARRGREDVSMEEFSAAIDRVVAGLEKKSRIISVEERERIAFHEVGHALAGELVGDQETAHKISIIPRGLGALGFTMQLPTAERHLVTETALRAKLVSLLGGRAAEELVFGEPSTGAQNDLQRATEIARAMVSDFGMSAAVGPVSVATERRPVLLGPMGGGGGFGHEVGATLADTIDSEVRRLVEAARTEATLLLPENRDALDRIARQLLAKEQLEGAELRHALDEVKRDHAARRAEKARRAAE